jgi:hypothetical protein
VDLLRQRDQAIDAVRSYVVGPDLGGDTAEPVSAGNPEVNTAGTP